MMRNTPRTFVGPVVFLLAGPVCAHLEESLPRELGRLPGISGCGLDVAAGAVVVTAVAPVDRTDVVAVLDRLGCRLRR